MSETVTVSELSGGRVARVLLDAGKGNVLDSRVLARLDEVFSRLGEQTRVRAVVLAASGKHFSFGASVPEHAPGEVEKMLPAFHRLFRTMSRSGVPVCTAVRGSCMGGGLELALAAQRLVVADDARLGVPEVTLGVFPPVAAVLLPLRCAQPVVDRLVGTGEIIGGVEAVRVGLADHVCSSAQVEEEALRWAGRYVELSGVAVRFATRAARAAWDEALDARLGRLEALYLEELMQTRDAQEGIRAFIEKRKPDWKDR